MDERKKLGKMGETFAAQVLELEGYMVTSRNYTCRYGEIDLVAERDGELCFVEVKTRRGDAFGMPSDAVTTAKQQNMKRAAACYMSEHRDCHEFFSFLVVEIGINTIENAF